MADFQRGLPERAFQTIHDLASCSSWMRDLLAEWAPSGTRGRLRLAIRNDCLNFYHLGQSVAKVEFPKGRGTAIASIHHKYVIPNTKETKYLKIPHAKGLDDTGYPCEWGGPCMLDKWIKEAACYADPEKREIDALLNRSPRVIDLEAQGAGRIDIAALEEASDGHPARIVFWEVKRINDGRLRSTRVPEVVNQIETYEKYVRSNRQIFENAYRETCRILCEFHRIASDIWETPRLLDPLISAVANGEPVEVDAEPRLLIIADETPKPDWERHRSELTRRLTDRVHLARRGDVDPIEAVPRVPHQWA